MPGERIKDQTVECETNPFRKEKLKQYEDVEGSGCHYEVKKKGKLIFFIITVFIRLISVCIYGCLGFCSCSR